MTASDQDVLPKIANYEVKRRLGGGALSHVYLAEQVVPVQRRVAIKVLRAAVDEAFLARFDVERQSLAWLDEERIARLLDSGTTEDGRPFLAIEYVQGLPITEYCDNERLSVRQRVVLFLDVCDAVLHAHQRGILHRDLKPNNVLVTQIERSPRVKVIDFGIAKLIAPTRAGVAQFQTESGEILGTPEYMAPEQAAGTQVALDVRADVYGLGVLLFQLLAGNLPVASAQLRGREWVEIRSVLYEARRPQVSNAALNCPAPGLRGRGVTTSRSLQRLLKGSLDAIVRRAIEPLARLRFGSVEALASDLRCWLESRRPVALRGNVREALRLFVIRWRRWLAVSAVLLLSLMSAVWAVVGAHVREADRIEGLRKVGQENLIMAQALWGQIGRDTPTDSPAWTPLLEHLQACLANAKAAGDEALAGKAGRLSLQVGAALDASRRTNEVIARKRRLFEALASELINWRSNSVMMNHGSCDRVLEALRQSMLLRDGGFLSEVAQDSQYSAEITPIVHMLNVDAQLWVRGLLRARLALEESGLLGQVSVVGVDTTIKAARELCEELTRLAKDLPTDRDLAMILGTLQEGCNRPQGELIVTVDAAHGSVTARAAAAIVECRLRRQDMLLGQLCADPRSVAHQDIVGFAAAHSARILLESPYVHSLAVHHPSLAPSVWRRLSVAHSGIVTAVLRALNARGDSRLASEPARVDLARAAAQSGDTVTAREVLGSIDTGRCDGLAMFNMALAFLALGEERRALECLHESIAKEPLSPRAWCSLGWLKIRARDFRGGLAARRIGHCIGLSQEDWLYDSGFWVREAEEFVDHHEHLQAILDGSQAPPSDSELCSAFQFAFSTNQVDAGLLLYEKLVGRRATQGEASLDRRTAISAAALVCRATFVPGISAMSVSEARKRAFVLLNGVVDSLTAEVLRGGDLSAVRRWAFQLADHPDLVTAQCQVARLHVDEAVAWGQLWRRVELMANP